MNILIVGNGFDLSHYLPTKYDHFMDVMKAIEKKDLSKPWNTVLTSPFEHPVHCLTKLREIGKAIDDKSYQMNFDELFGKCRENWFVSKTKEIYQTEDVLITESQIIKTQSLLKQNNWYQYFKKHVREVKTWIDFETKIEEVLKVIAIFVLRLETTISEYGLSSKEIILDSSEKSPIGQILLTREYCNVLEVFKVLKSGYYTHREFQGGERGPYYQEVEVEYDEEDDQNFKFNIEDDYALYQNGSYKVKVDKIISSLHQQLEDFIEIFNLYLELIVDKLEPKAQIKIEAESWSLPDHIYSFNYTNTFRKFYQRDIKAEFLHGRFGEEQNIVLGISDLEDKSLKKLKAYGFTKYHQKLFKNTDYVFLDTFKEKIKDLTEKHEKHKNTNYANFQVEQQRGNDIFELSRLNLNIFIWGHSLDLSDKDYINDLFCLNDDIDRNVIVTVYYFDKPAKFTLLNNLLAILDKEKVEKWMKKGWLIFEKNPEIKF